MNTEIDAEINTEIVIDGYCQFKCCQFLFAIIIQLLGH